MAEFLRHSSAIRKRLKALFSPNTRGRRRVIIVAYIGADAPDLLPDYKGVEVYCWPQTGATNPRALAQLASAKHGARVHLCDGLHMKLYWVDGIGCVVSSANLSKSALGERSLHECGVFPNDSDAVDIDAIIDGLDARPLRTSELATMQRRHDLYWSAVPTPGKSRHPRTPSFSDWATSSEVRPWKLGWWDEHGVESTSSAERARREFGVDEIDDYIVPEATTTSEVIGF